VRRVRDAPIEFFDLLFHVSLPPAPSALPTQEFLDLGEGESDVLAQADHRDALHRARRVLAASRGASGGRDQAEAFVVTEGRGGGTGAAGEFADVDIVLGHGNPLALKHASTVRMRGVARARQAQERDAMKQHLMHRVVAQFHRPTGVGGRFAGWWMATRPSKRRRNLWVVSLLDIGDADRVLEVGFGPGIAIREAASRAVHGMVCGVDHSVVMVRQARRRNAAAVRAGRVDLRLGTADQLPTFDEPFDKIFAVNSMGFWNQPVRCLESLGGVLRCGGRIAIASQPRRRGATAETSAEAGDTIAERLVEAGFVDVEIETLPLDPPVVSVFATRKC
jgi:SAM-dependent methyltransferase